MQALRNSSGFEPLGFSTASQGERNGSPLMVSTILSLATLSVATIPSSVVNWSIDSLPIEMDVESDRKHSENAVWPSLSARPHRPRSLQLPSARSGLTVEADPSECLAVGRSPTSNGAHRYGFSPRDQPASRVRGSL